MKTHLELEQFAKFRSKGARAAQVVVKCPYCDKIANKLNAGRWHFDRCKGRAVYIATIDFFNELDRFSKI